MKVEEQIKLIIIFLVFKAEFLFSSNNNFSEVARRPSFIDKSLLIKDVFEHEMVLLIAPTGYGKSTILDMMKRFLEITLDENYKPEPVYITDNYELFKKKDMKICRYPYDLFFTENCGKYPVLYIDYSSLCNVTDFDNMLSIFREILYKSFLPHKHILKDKKLIWFDESAKYWFSKYCDKLEYKKLSTENITRGLFLLSRMMCHHYSKRVFVLIDEYNTYLKCLPEKGIVDSEKIINFIQSINDDLIKFNAFIYRALMVGIPLMNDTDIWPDNIVKFKFLEKHDFQKYFGAYENEINKTLKKNYYKRNIKARVKTELFQNHNSLTVDGLKVFNFPTYLKVFRNITMDM